MATDDDDDDGDDDDILKAMPHEHELVQHSCCECDYNDSSDINVAVT